MIFDISRPSAPAFVQYVNTAPTDISPEGLVFVKADDSPTEKALLIVSNEVSGTIRVFELQKTSRGGEEEEEEEEEE